MSEPARIGLRLAGLLMLLCGIVGLVLLVWPGPSEVAGWMGENCRRSKHGQGDQCTVGDVVLLAAGAPGLIFLGGILTLTLRPKDRGPMELDLSRLLGGR